VLGGSVVVVVVLLLHLSPPHSLGRRFGFVPPPILTFPLCNEDSGLRYVNREARPMPMSNAARQARHRERLAARLAKAEAGAGDCRAKLWKELKPLVSELEAEGRKHDGFIASGTIAHIAHQMRLKLDPAYAAKVEQKKARSLRAGSKAKGTTRKNQKPQAKNADAPVPADDARVVAKVGGHEIREHKYLTKTVYSVGDKSFDTQAEAEVFAGRALIRK
jgi:hypothetical protein